MRHIDEAAVTNAAFWEQEVVQGGGHTLPWLDLDLDRLRRYLQGELDNDGIVGRKEPRRMVNMQPGDVHALGDVAGKDVLCLGCGGGQQSALFSLLGACVTVVDIAQGQLAGDKIAASHYEYEVTTIQGDMRDLSALQSESFDIVFGLSTCYVPDIRQVYLEVSRVLRVGGLYSTCMEQPAARPIEWDGAHYRLTQPYAGRNDDPEDEDGTMCFTHYMDDTFNGLIDAGLSLFHVEDRSRHKWPGAGAKPGSWTHEHAYVGGTFWIFARKAGS